MLFIVQDKLILDII